MRLEPRDYQQNIINSIVSKGNTLVVLPTGLGKTLIAFALIEKRMRHGKCIFLTPTKPLARQHYSSILGVLGISQDDISLLTGEQPAKKRKESYSKPVIISTPQTVRNDISRGYLDPEMVSLAIYDEAHRAVGDYAYVQIAETLGPKALSVGLTASPGGDKGRIDEVLRNLNITNVEVRSSKDADVRPYVKNLSFEWIPVELGGDLQKASKLLRKVAADFSGRMKRSGMSPPLASKRMFLEMRKKILAIDHPMKYRMMFNYSALLHVLHLQELLETQGPYPTLLYLDKIAKSESKSAQALTNRDEIREARELVVSGGEHPKMAKLLELLDGIAGSKVIVFVQYRDQIARIIDLLRTAGHRAMPFMGKRKEFTRKMQEETIDMFRRGDFEILVASSIGEEGLDIPAVDAVVFFEPIPSEIRSIQRRGRAGRFKDGTVYILMTRASRDEYYYWASVRREKKMKSILEGYRGKGLPKKPTKPEDGSADGQSKLSEFA